MGKIIQLGDHIWTMPEAPTSQEDVLFVKKNKKEDQFWMRDTSYPKVFFEFHRLAKINASKTTYDEDGLMITLSEDDTKIIDRILYQEMYRRIHGLWFMNYGELTYLTGAQYFQLQWGAMPDYENPYDGGMYGEFRWFQTRFHYFLKHCKDSKDCGGMFTGKAKKTGLTNLISIDLVEESTRIKQKRFGMMSKSQEDCKRTNFMYYTFCLDNLPMIFQPSSSNRNLTSIKFDKAKVKTTGTKTSMARQMEIQDGYNSEVFVAPTVAAAMDGPVMFRAVLDEFTKYEDPYPNAVFQATKETVKKGDVINGKLWIFCYSPEKDGTNLEEASKIFNDANLDTVDPDTRRTRNGLWNYFIDVLDSSEGNFDRYGKCDRDRARTIILANRKQLEDDPQSLQAYKRQYPMYVDEMWQEGGAEGSTYDNIRLGQRKIDLETELRINIPYEMGTLEWVNPEKVVLAGKMRQLDSLVKWVPQSDADKQANKKVPFTWFEKETIDERTLNLPVLLRQAGQTSKLEPVENHPYCGTWDPTDFVAAKDVTVGSKHSGMVGNFYDLAKDTLWGRPVTNIQIFDYHFRHENPLDDLENLIKLVLFWGCVIYIETNKPWMFEMVKQLELEKFIIVRHATKGLVTYNAKEHTKLPTTTRDVINDYVARVKTYLAKKKDAEGPDYIQTIKNLELIRHLMKFDVLNTKKFDQAVKFGLWRTLYDSLMLQRLKQEERGGDKTGEGIKSAMETLVMG